MKALLCPRYGPPEVLELAEVEVPTPTENQVLLKVHAASINTADLTFTGPLGRVFGGWSKPRDPHMGSDVAGLVESIGSNVTQLKPGNAVFGTCAGSCAEYAVAREIRLVSKPDNISFEEAAAVPVAGLTALQGLRDAGHIQPGQQVLINGASGGVGTFAVQIAKDFGAEVTAVCSPRNLDQARSMGADHVVDYTRDDFTRSGKQYDLILAVNGYHPIWDYKRALSPNGIYVMVGASHERIFSALIETAFLGPILSRQRGQKMGFMGLAKINQPDLAILRNLLASRKVIPVVEKCYPLVNAVEAFKYLAGGHARGKVVITTITEY